MKRQKYPMTIKMKFEWLKALNNSTLSKNEKLKLLKAELVEIKK